MSQDAKLPRMVVVGTGWTGLGATYHLANQSYDVLPNIYPPDWR